MIKQMLELRSKGKVEDGEKRMRCETQREHSLRFCAALRNRRPAWTSVGTVQSPCYYALPHIPDFDVLSLSALYILILSHSRSNSAPVHARCCCPAAFRVDQLLSQLCR